MRVRGSALSLIATHRLPRRVGVVPEPWERLPGLVRLPRSYAARQVTRGVPFRAPWRRASRR